MLHCSSVRYIGLLLSYVASVCIILLFSGMLFPAYATSAKQQDQTPTPIPLIATPTATTTTPTAAITPTVMTTEATLCSNLRTDNPGKGTLDFCSPIYQGDVAGPYGAHVVLVSENIPDGQIKWFYISTSSTNPVPKIDNDTAQRCLKGQVCPVKPLNDLQVATKRLNQAVIAYSFTWNGASFPKEQASYTIVAIVNVKNAAPFVIASSLAFTLLSTDAPCVNAYSTETASQTCTPHSQSITLSSSRPIILHGTNWLLETTQNGPLTGAMVSIFALCSKKSSTSCTQILLGNTSANAQGQFSQKITFPVNAKGFYDLCITSSNPIIATPFTDKTVGKTNNTIVTNSLTYGCINQGDPAGIRVMVTAQNQQPYSLVSFLSLENLLFISSLLALGLILPAVLFYMILSFGGEQYVTTETKQDQLGGGR